jgi:hypothetical protein
MSLFNSASLEINYAFANQAFTFKPKAVSLTPSDSEDDTENDNDENEMMGEKAISSTTSEENETASVIEQFTEIKHDDIITLHKPTPSAHHDNTTSGAQQPLSFGPQDASFRHDTLTDNALESHDMVYRLGDHHSQPHYETVALEAPAGPELPDNEGIFDEEDSNGYLEGFSDEDSNVYLSDDEDNEELDDEDEEDYEADEDDLLDVDDLVEGNNPFMTRTKSSRFIAGKEVPAYSHILSYTGHCNIQTTKDVNFYGLQDEYIVSGSDCGNFFIWDKKTSKLVNILNGDREVVNVIQRKSPERLIIPQTNIYSPSL